MEEHHNRENLKAVWKYYVLAFAGLGLVRLSTKTQGTLSLICSGVGAVCFMTGLLLTLYWDRKRKKADEEAGIKPYER